MVWVPLLWFLMIFQRRSWYGRRSKRMSREVKQLSHNLMNLNLLETLEVKQRNIPAEARRNIIHLPRELWNPSLFLLGKPKTSKYYQKGPQSKVQPEENPLETQMKVFCKMMILTAMCKEVWMLQHHFYFMALSQILLRIKCQRTEISGFILKYLNLSPTSMYLVFRKEVLEQKVNAILSSLNFTRKLKYQVKIFHFQNIVIFPILNP